MAAPILVAKAVLFGIKNWKPILVALFAATLLVVMFPVFVLSSFLPSAEDQIQEQYQSIANDAGLDWIEMLVIDTVRYDNNFSKANPSRTGFEFLKLSYTKYRKVESCSTITRTNSNGETEYCVVGATSTSWMTSDEIAALPVGTQYSLMEDVSSSKEVVDTGTATSYAPIVSTMQSLGYSFSGEVIVKDVLNFVNSKSGDELLSVSVSKLTMVNLLYGMDDDHKEWAYNLYTSLIDENDAFGMIREFNYNTDPSFMAGITLDASAYRQGNTSILTGDTDINSIFAGRLSALAEDYGHDEVGITSGYRSYEEQQQIWDNTPEERRGIYVAAPGHSRHQYGIAADVRGWLLYVTNSQLLKYGLYKPMSYEDWHIEPIETKTGP